MPGSHLAAPRLAVEIARVATPIEGNGSMNTSLLHLLMQNHQADFIRARRYRRF
jgi:hypothetical protein